MDIFSVISLSADINNTLLRWSSAAAPQAVINNTLLRWSSGPCTHGLRQSPAPWYWSPFGLRPPFWPCPTLYTTGWVLPYATQNRVSPAPRPTHQSESCPTPYTTECALLYALHNRVFNRALRTRPTQQGDHSLHTPYTAAWDLYTPYATE